VYAIGAVEDENHISGTWTENGPFYGTWRAVRK